MGWPPPPVSVVQAPSRGKFRFFSSSPKVKFRVFVVKSGHLTSKGNNHVPFPLLPPLARQCFRFLPCQRLRFRFGFSGFRRWAFRQPRPCPGSRPRGRLRGRASPRPVPRRRWCVPLGRLLPLRPPVLPRRAGFPARLALAPALVPCQSPPLPRSGPPASPPGSPSSVRAPSASAPPPSPPQVCPSRQSSPAQSPPFPWRRRASCLSSRCNHVHPPQPPPVLRAVLRRPRPPLALRSARPVAHASRLRQPSRRVRVRAASRWCGQPPRSAWWPRGLAGLRAGRHPCVGPVRWPSAGVVQVFQLSSSADAFGSARRAAEGERQRDTQPSRERP